MFATATADVAQLVEQRFRKPQVTGSNPVVGSSLRLDAAQSDSCYARVKRRQAFLSHLASDALQSYGLAGTRLRIPNFKCRNSTIERSSSAAPPAREHFQSRLAEGELSVKRLAF
jgi:hypothetical protein